MLKMVICCAGGMSSSIMANKVKKEIEERNLQSDVTMTFMSFAHFKKAYQEFDIAFLCPHQLYEAKRYCSEVELPLPVYIIPSLMYGTMYLDDLLEDAQDLLKIYKEKKENPIHFPDEQFLVIDRNTSHRRWLKFQQRLQNKFVK